MIPRAWNGGKLIFRNMKIFSLMIFSGTRKILAKIENISPTSYMCCVDPFKKPSIKHDYPKLC